MMKVLSLLRFPNVFFRILISVVMLWLLFEFLGIQLSPVPKLFVIISSFAYIFYPVVEYWTFYQIMKEMEAKKE